MRQLAKLLLLCALILICGFSLKSFPHAALPSPVLSRELVGDSVLALVASYLTAWFVCWLIVRYEDMHSHFSHDEVGSGPQKFHAVPTPRIGGIAVAAGLLGGSGAIFALLPQVALRDHGYLVLASVPAFLGGLIEDITKRVGVTERLLTTMLSAAMGAGLVGGVLVKLDLPLIDTALGWAPFAIFFTVIAVGGMANAVNIIDGYNGLAGGQSLMSLAAIAIVAYATSDFLIFSSAFAISGGVAGFLWWNWPRGKIFLGDGGAYLLGFLLGELSVLLVVRNPEVSAWFPLLLLVHPIVETLFSIYRRRFLRGHAPGKPDALHLHQLIFSRVLRYHVGTGCANKKLLRNSMVAPYIWTPSGLVSILAIAFFSNTAVLMSIAAFYAVFYVISYRAISSWRTPSWLKRRAH